MSREPFVVITLPLAEAEELVEVLTHATPASLEVGGFQAQGAAILQLRALERLRAALKASSHVESQARRSDDDEDDE